MFQHVRRTRNWRRVANFTRRFHGMSEFGHATIADKHAWPSEFVCECLSFSSLPSFSFVLSSAFRYCLQTGLEGAGLLILSRPFTNGLYASASNSGPLHLHLLLKIIHAFKDCRTAIVPAISYIHQQLFVIIQGQAGTTCSSASGQPTSYSISPSKPITLRLSTSACIAPAPPLCTRQTK